MANQKSSFSLTPEVLAAPGLINVAADLLLVEHRQRVARAAFDDLGDEYRHYMEATPAWIAEFKAVKPEFY